MCVRRANNADLQVRVSKAIRWANYVCDRANVSFELNIRWRRCLRLPSGSMLCYFRGLLHRYLHTHNICWSVPGTLMDKVEQRTFFPHVVSLSAVCVRLLTGFGDFDAGGMLACVCVWVGVTFVGDVVSIDCGSVCMATLEMYTQPQ